MILIFHAQNDNQSQCTLSFMENEILGNMKRTLSQYNHIGVLRNTPTNANRDFNHTNLLVVAVIERCSATTKDLEKVVSFLVRHKTGDPSRGTR